MSSFGHVRDLPKSELGIDIEQNFEPRYVIPTKSRKTIGSLKKAAEKAELIILATDDDREGEAIAYHLVNALNVGDYQRIVFHEITKPAIERALKNFRKIDMNLVDSQQARRVLDRIVGYKLSPFLWKKVARGLSAGRVQSVAVKLICDREEEINKFKPEEYWQIEVELVKNDKFNARLIKISGKVIPKPGIKSKKEAEGIVKDLEKAEYVISDVEKKEIRKNPFPPFTTSSLQQEAWKKFHFSAKLTMRVAQQLYEKGFTSYHRTDSLNIADQALWSAKEFIQDKIGKEYWTLRKYKTKSKGAQEAQEAIRPTNVNRAPELLTAKLDKNQLRLYGLIWRRFIASQMSSAVFYATTVDISAQDYGLRANGQTLKFDGFLKIYPIKYQENKLPLLERNDKPELVKVIPSQHFTQPLPRYNEASLIKALEENGIGRPSTYAPIISVIQDRNYVENDENKRFRPTEIGLTVNNLLAKHFSNIVDIKFTAKMEEGLDEIARGKVKWNSIIKEFYVPFEKNLEERYKDVVDKKLNVEKTDKKCPECGACLVVRFGRFGKFYACPGFPKCKHTEPLESSSLGIKCPKCGKGDIIEKRTSKRKIFYGCSGWPKCDFALWDKPLKEKCDKCGSLMVETKKGKKCCKCA